MSKFTFARKTKAQNQMIIREINMLLRVVAYDGRENVKVRFRKAKNTSDDGYVIDVYLKDSHEASAFLTLKHNPFNMLWHIISKNQILEGTYLSHCRKSRYGGYTFY